MIATLCTTADAVAAEKLLLEPDLAPPYCVTALDTQVTINIVLTDIDPNHPILAANLNLVWQPDSCWQVVDIMPGPGFDQFGSETTGPGFIKYSVTRELGLPGIVDPQPIAVVVFQTAIAPDACCVEEISLIYGSGAAATKLVGAGGYVQTRPLLGEPKLIRFDAAPPVITCAGDMAVNAWPGNCVWWPSPPQPIVQPLVSDNCPDGLVIDAQRSDGRGLNAAYDVGVTTITWTAIDDCGNMASCVQIITVQDIEPPLIESPFPNNRIQRHVNAGCQYILEDIRPLLTIVDNCEVDPQVQQTPPPGTVFGPGLYDLVINANDSHGNNAMEVFTLWVRDMIPPVFIRAPGLPGSPPPPVVYAEAGTCGARVEWTISASDNCGTVTVRLLSALGSGDLFPIGQTTVQYEARDSANNITAHIFNVTVLPFWLIDVEIELKGYVSPGPFDWCVKLELVDCQGVLPGRTAQGAVTFTRANGEESGGNGSLGRGIGTIAVAVPEPCRTGAYTCARAKVPRRSLWSKTHDVGLTMDGGPLRFTARFVGEDALVLGNINDDIYIDLLDWFIWQDQFMRPEELPSPDPGDPCAVPSTLADFTGDGLVTATDFGHLYVNNLAEDDSPCMCSQAAGQLASGGIRPVTRVSVRQLRAMGMERAAEYDINNDGFVDMSDLLKSTVRRRR